MEVAVSAPHAWSADLPPARTGGVPPRRCFLAAAALLALGGCSRTEAPAPAPVSATGADAAADASSARSAFERAAQGRGFVVGQALATRVLLVFFDPQCPACAALWAAVRPLRDRVRLVWMLVAFVAPPSPAQGALLLAAADPTRAMDEHEAALTRGEGGLRVDAPPSMRRCWCRSKPTPRCARRWAAAACRTCCGARAARVRTALTPVRWAPTRRPGNTGIEPPAPAGSGRLA
jgi:hypothetical protein